MDEAEEEGGRVDDEAIVPARKYLVQSHTKIKFTKRARRENWACRRTLVLEWMFVVMILEMSDGG